MNPIQFLIQAGLSATIAANSITECRGWLNVPRFGLVAAEISGRIYVAGGRFFSAPVAEVFDPQTDLTKTLLTRLQPRYFLGGAARGERVYLVGGLSDTGWSERFEEWDPNTGKVRLLPPIPVPVARPGVAVVEDRLYVIGGEASSGVWTNLVQIFDFTTEAWTRGADMPIAREGMVVVHEGKILAPGGYNGQEALRSFYAYDPAADRWEQKKDLPRKMSAHSGVMVDGVLYTFGDYELLNRAAAWTASSDEWALIDIPYQPSRHNAAVRCGDTVYVLGGNRSSRGLGLSNIQRFPIPTLVAAARRPWTEENEPAPTRSAHPEREEVEARREALIGKPAPDFNLTLLDGQEFRLSDHTGRVVVIDFWASWCPPCVAALSDMVKLANEWRERDVTVLGFSLDDPAAIKKVQGVVVKHGVKYSVGLGDRDIAKLYGVYGIPHFTVIGPDGIVRKYFVGASRDLKQKLREAVDELLPSRAEGP